MKKRILLLALGSVGAVALLSGCNVKVGAPNTNNVNGGNGEYTLGGNISGLTGANLELIDNVGNPPDNVMPTQGTSTFSFLTGQGYLKVGQSYNVTVAQQPLGQRCSVTNASGTVVGVVLGNNGAVQSTGNITNVAVACVSPTINTALTTSAYQSVTSGQSTNGATSIAIAPSGTIYAADQDTGLLLNVTQPSVATAVTLKNTAGSVISSPGIRQIAIDASGNLYAAANTGSGGSVIEKIAPGNVVTVLAGSSAEGSTDGTGTAASFGNQIKGIAVDPNGNLYVADYDSIAQTSKIRKVVISTGVVTTLAGAGPAGSANGTGAAASFNFSSIRGNLIAADTNGVVYVVEKVNNDVRMITPAGVVTTFAGSPSKSGTADSAGGATATFTSPTAIATATYNSIVYVYVLDGNGNVRMIMPNGNVSTLVGAGVPFIGSNGTVGTTGGLGNATCLATDASSNLFTSIAGSSTSILKVTFG